MSLPDDFWELPLRHVGHQVLVFRCVSSTNDVAASLAEDLAHAGVAILAESQTAGRGQYGRSWVAPPKSSVLLSVLLFPPVEFRRPALLTAWASVAVALTVEQVCGESPAIKWPNDVLLRGRKVCGVLIEQGRGIITGIGLNVNQTSSYFVQANLPTAASLRTVVGQSFDTFAIARLLLDRLDQLYDRMMRGQISELELLWNTYLDLREREVIAETFDGTTVRGRLMDASFDFLRIRRADGLDMIFRPEQVKVLSSAMP
ncbi:MAG: biotin--[acetyl-CoA-carboxylase] ligase [Gemmataceae bacterium]|nr:biotin--[acetyl-CoA-carboxylase] ligase [Gemmataceae bacterium]